MERKKVKNGRNLTCKKLREVRVRGGRADTTGCCAQVKTLGEWQSGGPICPHQTTVLCSSQRVLSARGKHVDGLKVFIDFCFCS